MHDDWFPFFSMLFWCCTKLAGLSLFVTGLIGLGTTLLAGFDFWRLLLAVALPLVVGYLLLAKDFLYDLAIAEQRRRQAKAR